MKFLTLRVWQRLRGGSSAQLFATGQVVATVAAVQAVTGAGVSVNELVRRHAS